MHKFPKPPGFKVSAVTRPQNYTKILHGTNTEGKHGEHNGCSLQVTREAFLAAVAHHHHRPLSFDILGRRREEGHQAVHEEGGPKVSENPLPSSPDQDIFSFYEEPYDHTTFNSTMFPLHDSNVPLESYELRVTLVWAPLASVVSSPLSREKMKIVKLKEWQKQEVIPDAIVVGESIFRAGGGGRYLV